MPPEETAETTAVKPRPAKSVRDRFREQKEAGTGLQTTTLPKSGIDVTYPGFLSHDKVMAAAKIAGKNTKATAKVIIAQVCLFEGERLTVEEIGSLVDNRDVTHLTDLLFGEDEDDAEGGEGN